MGRGPGMDYTEGKGEAPVQFVQWGKDSTSHLSNSQPAWCLKFCRFSVNRCEMGYGIIRNKYSFKNSDSSARTLVIWELKKERMLVI